MEKIIRAELFHLGSIRTSNGDLLAIYTIESLAKEEDFESRKCHYAWMKARGVKPGDIKGCASNLQGTELYQF